MDCSLPGSSVHEILQAILLKWVGVHFSRGSSQPRDQPRSPTLQVNPLSSEPPGKPNSSGVGNLSLLQGIFLTQGLLNCRWILYQLSYLCLPKILRLGLHDICLEFKTKILDWRLLTEPLFASMIFLLPWRVNRSYYELCITQKWGQLKPWHGQMIIEWWCSICLNPICSFPNLDFNMREKQTLSGMQNKKIPLI